MTLDESIDIVVARTNHIRYRDLCRDDNPDTAQRDRYRALVVSMATGEPVARHTPHRGVPMSSATPRRTVPLSDSLRLTKLAKRCPYRSKPKCGCSGSAACALRGGSDVSAHECWDCVRLYGL